MLVNMTQWGVGHGGFHTTEVAFSGNDGSGRRYIYDCGSTAPDRDLGPRIESYVQGLKSQGKRQIDTLYLSHFDYDHVSGLEKLATELAPEVRIEKVVAPFLTPAQQLATIASQTSPYEPLYVDLVLDPQQTLERLFPGAAVELLAPTDVEEVSEETGLSTSSPGSMVINSHSRGLGSELVWEIIPLVLPEVNVKSAEFMRELRENGLVREKHPDTETLRDLVETQRPKLRQLANKFLGADGCNSSSIILYSAPALGYSVKCFIQRGGNRIRWRELPANAESWRQRNAEKFGGWLSTGDARLETSVGVDRLVRGLGAQRAKRVTVISAPHHGSKNNSSSYLWKAFTNATFVTAHTRKGSAHHPSQLVRDELKNNHRKLFEVVGSSSDISMSCGT